MNEDRALFFPALGLDWCSAGNHAAGDAFTYQGSNYCPSHLPPGGHPDPAMAGRCHAEGGHWADRLWYVGLDGNWYCITHLKRIVLVALWKL